MGKLGSARWCVCVWMLLGRTANVHARARTQVAPSPVMGLSPRVEHDIHALLFRKMFGGELGDLAVKSLEQLVGAVNDSDVDLVLQRASEGANGAEGSCAGLPRPSRTTRTVPLTFRWGKRRSRSSRTRSYSSAATSTPAGPPPTTATDSRRRRSSSLVSGRPASSTALLRTVSGRAGSSSAAECSGEAGGGAGTHLTCCRSARASVSDLTKKQFSSTPGMPKVAVREPTLMAKMSYGTSNSCEWSTGSVPAAALRLAHTCVRGTEGGGCSRSEGGSWCWGASQAPRPHLAVLLAAPQHSALGVDGGAGGLVELSLQIWRACTWRWQRGVRPGRSAHACRAPPHPVVLALPRRSARIGSTMLWSPTTPA